MAGNAQMGIQRVPKRWSDIQAGFAMAVRDADQPVPPGVAVRGGMAAARQFAVYRNNSAVSLVDALCDSYPVVRALVGEAFFRAMAKVFVEQNLPLSPVLLAYGAGFADFIAAFPPAAELTFLADVARVERAWSEAYHAADADPLEIAALGEVDETVLAQARFRLHPSVRLVASQHPVVSIWQAHNFDDGDACQDVLRAVIQQPEACMMVRPTLDVTVHLLAEATFGLIAALGAGRCLGEAAEGAAVESTDDLAGMLGFVFSIGAIAAVDV
jgi:Putative DNA-binding domain